MSRHLTSRERLTFKLDHLSETEVQEVLDYISIMETMKRERARPEMLEDELLALLSAARENRRARQVVEWEKVRLNSDSRAAVPRKQRAAHR